MKGTDHFKRTIQMYLEQRAEEDTLFAKNYRNPAKNIDDCVTYMENPLKVVPLIHSNLTPVKFSHSPFCLFLFSSYSSCPLCRVLH